MTDKELEQEFEKLNSRPMYFDRKGKPLKLLEWAKLFEDFDYKVIKQEVVGKYWVSTVWLGMNHSFARLGPPLIFETMVFENQKKKMKPTKYFPKGMSYREEVDVERYSTEEEAKTGHKRLVKKYGT